MQAVDVRTLTWRFGQQSRSVLTRYRPAPEDETRRQSHLSAVWGRCEAALAELTTAERFDVVGLRDKGCTNLPARIIFEQLFELPFLDDENTTLPKGDAFEVIVDLEEHRSRLLEGNNAAARAQEVAAPIVLRPQKRKTFKKSQVCLLACVDPADVHRPALQSLAAGRPRVSPTSSVTVPRAQTSCMNILHI